MAQNISEEGAKNLIIMLRKMDQEIMNEQMYCHKRNFKLEQMSLMQQHELLSKIIMQCQNHFDLGFVWDKTLD